MQVTAIVVAAGKGLRLGLGFNKVYAELAGKPVLAYSLEVLERNKDISQIIVVAAKSEIDAAKEVIEKYAVTKAKNIVAGGSTRFRSVAAALPYISCKSDVVLVHDGARPLLSAADLTAVIKAGSYDDGAILATPVTDTVKQVELFDNAEKNQVRGVILHTPDRKLLWRALTPQVFPVEIFLEAYGSLGCSVTDDASLLESCGANVKIVEGSSDNIKITNPVDLAVAELLLQKKAGDKKCE
ncbi:MAG: 2-C-methyl-D-erythritol 4-phosphate cytidylyltransferase [Bacillota bacterium]|jgi:2-C-methyl-D-erythritol 4-phosphate cytidylyltransferase